MSTTVNVRVDKSRLTQQLKDNSAATQQQAAQQAVDEAAAEQVRSNNEALRRRQQDANAKFRKSRHDPIGRRDGGQVTLPNQLVDDQLTGPVVLEDGAAVRVARVGIRYNADKTKAFVYPWGIEGALGRRLSDSYTAAVNEAWAVGVEVNLGFETRVPAPPPTPVGNREGFQSWWLDYEGTPYDATPTTKRNSLWRWGDVSLINGIWYFAHPIVLGCLSEEGKQEKFKSTDFYLEDKLSFGGVGRACSYFAGYDADQGSKTNTMKSSGVKLLYSAVPGSPSPYPHNELYTFILPAGGDRSLVVFVKRALYYQHMGRFFWEYEATKYSYYINKAITATLREYETHWTDLAVTGQLNLGLTEESIDKSILNITRCVLVTGSRATEVEPSPELLDACNELIPLLDKADRTGQRTLDQPLLSNYSYGDAAHKGTDRYDFYQAEVASAYRERPAVKQYTDYTYPAFEVANFPKPPYSDKPPAQQVLDKQLGIGYLETSDHSGKFFTPAIYEWLGGKAKLKTRYSEVATAFYQPGDANNPFVGVYLSVGKGTENAIEMRATATQPADITTAHTALDWVTINTGSRYGDYLVWDWGNPEYCRQRLQALGMNV